MLVVGTCGTIGASAHGCGDVKDTIPAKIITEMRGADFIVFRIN